MTKSELIKRLLKNHANLTQKDISTIMDAILGEICDALVEGKRIELRGFGAFSVRKREPRQARNPKTNEAVKLGARATPYFRAGKEMRDRVNKGNTAAAS